MTDLTKNKLFKSATFIVSYDAVTNIRQKSSAFENTFNVIFDKEPTYTNVPDDNPPDVPRFILQSRKSERMLVSQENVRYEINFTDNISKSDHNKCFDVLKKRLNTILRNLPEIDKFVIREFAVVYSINYSTKDLELDLNDYLMNTFFKISTPKKIGSVEFKFSTIDNDKYFTNYNVSVYNIHDVTLYIKQIQQGNQTTVNVKVDDLRRMPIVDKGIGCVVDVNNKYERQTQEGKILSLDDVTNIFEFANDAFRKKIDKFIVHGVI